MAGATSRKNGKKGGRPKSNHTLASKVKRELIAEWIAPHMEKMVMAQVRKAKKGDTKAFKELCDRAYDRPLNQEDQKATKGDITWYIGQKAKEARRKYTVTGGK